MCQHFLDLDVDQQSLPVNDFLFELPDYAHVCFQGAEEVKLSDRQLHDSKYEVTYNVTPIMRLHELLMVYSV